MKKNNSYLVENEIDLKNFIRGLFREKILILSISFIFCLLGYLYTSFKHQEFKTEITLKKPSLAFFEINSPIHSNATLAEQFGNDFEVNFLSIDNLVSFLESNSEYEDFNRYLKSRDINASQYFKGRFGALKENNIIKPNAYFLTFTKELRGEIFFDNYVEFIKNKTLKEFKNDLTKSLQYVVNEFKEALETSIVINLENPILMNMNDKNDTTLANKLSNTIAPNKNLFFRGSKVLEQDIVNIEKSIFKLKNYQMNYTPILNKASKPELISKPRKFYIFFFTLFGFCFSIVIIFLRDILQNKI